MQYMWKILLLFLLIQGTFAREVNNRYEERNPDVEILRDFLEDKNEIDEASLETEDEEETDDDDFSETEDDEGGEEFDLPETELPVDDNKEEKPMAAPSGPGRCSRDQLSYFPNRLRDWFYIIKQDLAERKEEEEDEEILLPIKENEDSETDRKWVEAALWKFCDLDAEPRDRYLSRAELAPLRNPLVAMEPCIDPFLADCDSNGDTQITLREWGRCLGLRYDEIKDDCEVL